MEHQYLINMWFGGGANETGMLLRTESKDEWIAKISELVHERHLIPSETRTTVFNDFSIWSFSSTADGKKSLVNSVPLMPLAVKWGLPKGVAECSQNMSTIKNG